MTESIIEHSEIEKILPHRYPFLFLDRVVDYDVSGDNGYGFPYIKAIKNVTGNEEFFRGHFPGNPVMPGVLMIEIIAQAASVLGLKMLDDSEGVIFYFAGVENAKFSEKVIPGDSLEIFVKITRSRGGLKVADGQIIKIGNSSICCKANIKAFMSKESE